MYAFGVDTCIVIDRGCLRQRGPHRKIDLQRYDPKGETIATSRKLSYSLESTSTEQSDSLGTAGVWVHVTIIYTLTIMGKPSSGIIKFTPFYDGNSCRVESSKSQDADEIVKYLKKQKGK